METRSIKELLQVLLDNVEIFETGLCILARELKDQNIIMYDEYLFISEYLEINLPNPIYRSDDSIRIITPRFSFPYGEWPPRKEWLEQEINKLKAGNKNAGLRN